LLKLDTKKLALASILGALAAASEVIKGPPFDIPFPLMPNAVSWDLTGLPMMISLLFAGPVAAVYTSVIGCSIIFLRGNAYGGTLKLIAELATILAFAAIRKGFIAKTVAAVTSRVLVMSVANYYLLPIFYVWASPEYVLSILVPLGIFNVTQALINIIPAQIIYNRLGGWWRLQIQGTKPLDSAALKT
jgi:riboflavin transporter FmnP